MLSNAELVIADGELYVRGRGCLRAIDSSRERNLCHAAVNACTNGQNIPLPDTFTTVGYIDAVRGEINLHPRYVREVEAVWGVRIDRRQLCAVADEREANERSQFRRAVMRGDRTTMNRLGPSRRWRW